MTYTRLCDIYNKLILEKWLSYCKSLEEDQYTFTRSNYEAKIGAFILLYTDALCQGGYDPKTCITTSSPEETYEYNDCFGVTIPVPSYGLIDSSLQILFVKIGECFIYYNDAVRYRATADSKLQVINRRDVPLTAYYNKMELCYCNYQYDYPAFNKYKFSPRFWKSPHAHQRMFGFEFEFLFPSFDEKINFAHEIKEFHRPCICEKDGSLDGGSMTGPSLELITPPYSYAMSKNKCRQLLLLAKKHGAVEPPSNYGLHITVNVNNAVADKMIYIINHHILREFLLDLSHRGRDHDQHYYKFQDYSSFEAVCKIGHIQRWEAHPPDHFYATYLRPHGGLELRFFKSTVDFSHFRRILKVVNSIRSFALNTSKQDLETSMPNLLSLLYVCHRS